MLKLKRLSAIVMSIAISAVFFTGCGDDESSTKTTTGSDADGSSVSDVSDNAESSETGDTNGDVNMEMDKIANFTPPEKGEEIIVMTIKDYGDVKIKLFPEQAQKGVENFSTHAKDGYYDGLIFHRIISNFMIQGGDPQGTGMGGESIWGEKFDGGTSPELCHVTGAVAYANSGSTATNGSQFYIVTGEKGETLTSDYFENLESQNQQMYAAGMSTKVVTWSDEAKKIYGESGGYPFLDGGYTVFGQVFDGLDIIMNVQNVETDGNDKPTTQVEIEKMTVEKYNGEDVKFHISDY